MISGKGEKEERLGVCDLLTPTSLHTCPYIPIRARLDVFIWLERELCYATLLCRLSDI